MLHRYVKLSSVEEIHKFVKKCSKLDCEVDLASDRYTVDAKSILGVFSVDLTNRLEVLLHTEDEKEVQRVLGEFVL